MLERLVVEMYVRGLSTRDIEDALAELAPGQGSLLSFANAVYESLRQQAGLKQGVLVSWAILADG